MKTSMAALPGSGGFAVGLTFATAVVGAFMLAGWFAGPVEVGTVLAIVVAGGAVAGLCSGGTAAARLFHAAIAVVAALGSCVATAWYVADRSSAQNVEILLAVAIGAAPGLVVMLVIWFCTRPGVVRVVLASPAVGAALVLCASAGAGPREEALRVVDRAAVAAAARPILLGREERYDLVTHLGPAGDELVKQIEIANEIADMFRAGYGITDPQEMARRLRTTLEKLEAPLAAVLDEADRRRQADELDGLESVALIEVRIRAALALARSP